jgi:hypothetical protein
MEEADHSDVKASVTEREKSIPGRSASISYILENPEALGPFIQIECVCTDPSRATSSWKKVQAQRTRSDIELEHRRKGGFSGPRTMQ